MVVTTLETKLKGDNHYAITAIRKAVQYLQKYKQGIREIGGINTLVWARARYRDYTVYSFKHNITWDELVRSVGLSSDVASEAERKAIEYWKSIGGPYGIEPMDNIKTLRQKIQEKIAEEKAKASFIYRYQDAKGAWREYRTNRYDWMGAIPVVDVRDGKIKVDWLVGSAFTAEKATGAIVYSPELGVYVRPRVLKLLGKMPPKAPDLPDSEIERLNKLNEKGCGYETRVAVKRPWGIEYWKPELVKRALMEGHLSEDDILGEVPASFVVKSEFKDGKLNIVEETPAVFFKEHPDLFPFKEEQNELNEVHQQNQQIQEIQETKVDEVEEQMRKNYEYAKKWLDLDISFEQWKNLDITAREIYLKEAYRKHLIHWVESYVGNLNDLPSNVRNKLMEAIDRKVNGEDIDIQILGLKLPDFKNIIRNDNRERKPYIEDELTERVVELEYKGDTEANVVERLKIGAELAGLGIATGLINVGKGIVELSKTAVKNPIEAGKMFVIGTAEWFASIPEKIWSGFTESPYHAGVLVGETVGGLVVGEGLRVASKPIPRPAFAKLTILKGGGAEPKLGTIRYGITIHALEKPLITIAKGEEGIKVGRVVSAPKEAIEGKAVTAYSKLETEFFKKTVEEHAKSPEHAEIFELGYDITSKIYSTKEPVVKPEKFEILSEHIPESAKPIVKEVITSYKGDIEVYGSVAQKLQMGEYMTRQPKDIEVIVDNPQRFVSELEKKLESSGVEYKIEGSPEKPKIYFKIGKEWVKGIEVFSKKGKEGYLSIFGGKRSAIAYGFEEQKPLKVEEVELLRLSEQAARKLEGGHVFKEGEIVPKHEGRWKDVSDLIEIATAYAIEKGLPIERQLVEYAKLRVKLHGKYIESPIAKFIAEKGRLPTYEELVKITREAGVKLPELRDLLFKRERSSYLPRATDILDISYYLSLPKHIESYTGFSYNYDILSEFSPEISSNIETSSKAKGSASQSKNERSSKPSTPSKGKSSSPKPSKPKTPSSKPKTTIGKPPSIPSKSSGGSSKPSAGISTIISTPEIPSVPSAPRSVLKRETRKQTRKSREMRRKVERNIYNVYQSPLKVVSKAMKQIDRILKEIGL